MGQTMQSRTGLATVFFVLSSTAVMAEELNIVSWNVSPAFYEAIPGRTNDFHRLSQDLDPDVLVLIEVAGDLEVRRIAAELGWKRYYGIVTDLAIARSSAFEALETAVISKLPIVRVTEYDTSVDGHHEVFTQGDDIGGLVNEERLTADGIEGFGHTLASFDRGTLRVDLEGDLTLFPVHLKSNRNNECFDLRDAIGFLNKQGFNYDASLDKAYESGFNGATARRKSNAQKRERVMAAIGRVAANATGEGRTTLISGDFNTAFEAGKYGREIDDCDLKDFSCKKGPFPVNACSGGDGFDDTLGMLEAGLISDQSWVFLSKDFSRTYKDKQFANAAIDHFAVDSESASSFSDSFVADQLYGSDHYPIVTTYTYQ